METSVYGKKISQVIKTQSENHKEAMYYKIK